jgi:hypothetical protein
MFNTHHLQEKIALVITLDKTRERLGVPPPRRVNTQLDPADKPT